MLKAISHLSVVPRKYISHVHMFWNHSVTCQIFYGAPFVENIQMQTSTRLHQFYEGRGPWLPDCSSWDQVQCPPDGFAQADGLKSFGWIIIDYTSTPMKTNTYRPLKKKMFGTTMFLYRFYRFFVFRGQVIFSLEISYLTAYSCMSWNIYT